MKREVLYTYIYEADDGTYSAEAAVTGYSFRQFHSCGHRHRTWEAAEACERKTWPGIRRDR